MSEIIATLLEQREYIFRGLQNGDLVRYGGVIRKAVGTPGAGQIVGFLKEVAPNVVMTINPSAGLALKIGMGAFSTGMKAYGDYKTQSIIKEGFNLLDNKIDLRFDNLTDIVDKGFASTQKSLGNLLNISSVGAAASVLNLGLTAVGFAIMNHKINNLQKSVNFLHAKVDNIDNALNDITQILVEIRYLQYLHGQDLAKIIEDIYGLEMALFLQHIAEIRMVTGNLQDYNQVKNKNISGYIDTLTTNRYWFEGMVDNKLNLNSQEKILSMINYYRGWTVSAVSEIQALRMCNELEKAAKLADETSKKSKEWSHFFVDKIAPQSELGGTKRFGYHKFQTKNLISPEQVSRVLFLQEGKELAKKDIIQYSLDGGQEVSKLNPSEEWLKHQAALANILDTVEEINERIESYALETNFCNDNRLGYEEWERSE